MAEPDPSPISFDPRQPVTLALMGQLLDHIKQDTENVSGENACMFRDRRIGRKRVAILGYLETILKPESWPADAKEPLKLTPKVGKTGASTMESVTSAVRTCLRLACKDLHPHEAFHVTIKTIDECTITLVWKANESAIKSTARRPVEPERYERVVAFGKLWRTEFAFEFMRGAHAMARELGIRFDDLRGEKNSYIDREYVAEKVSTLDPERDSILFFFEAPTQAHALKVSLTSERFSVVETGFNDAGGIGIDNKTLGAMLMEQLIKDASQREGIVLDLVFKVISSKSHGTISRSEVYESTLSENKRLTYEPLEVEGSAYVEGAEACVIAALDGRFSQGDAAKIIAITTKTEKSTMAAVDYLRARPDLGHVSCYSESIVLGVLTRLCDPTSPLKAVCGTDFYHYGRYVVRVASLRHPPDHLLRKLPPLLITQAEAIAHHIHSPERIPPHFKGVDVQFAGHRFAWPE